MTVVYGEILDAGGSPLTGEMVISLASFETTPNTAEIRLTEPHIEAVTAGVFEVTLVSLEQPYRWVFNKIESVVTLDENDEEVTTEVKTLMFDFFATVPPVATLLMSELVPTQIVRDNMDTSAKRIADLISLDPALRALVQLQLNPRGLYEPDAFYTRDDLVVYDGGSYMAKTAGFWKGINPTVATNWFPLSERGEVGTGTDGNDTAYDEAGWLGQTDAPSRNAVRNIVEGLNSTIAALEFAPIDSPVFTGPVTVPDTAPSASDSNAINSSSMWGALASIMLPSALDSPFCPTPAPNSNTKSLINSEWFFDRIGKVIIPGVDNPNIIEGTCTTPVYSSNSPAIANAVWVRNRTGGINLISSSPNHIRLATETSTGNGIFTARFGQFTSPSLTTSLVSGVNSVWFTLTLPAAVPLFTGPTCPVTITGWFSSVRHLILNFTAFTNADTRDVTITMTTSAPIVAQNVIYSILSLNSQ